ncbi:MAG: ABC transporter permease [Chloroflexi bacterium]|nr:ABC transporter permease [Chloroflexota bacterium]
MALWVGALTLGLGFAGMALGVYLTFRVLSFPDLTVDGSFPLGAAVAAVLMVSHGWAPWATLPMAAAAGCCAGLVTGLLNTRLGINGLLAGILVSIGLWTVNLRVMGDRANLPLLGVGTILTPFRPLTVGMAEALNVSPNDVSGLLVFFLLAVMLAVGTVWLLRTELGLALRATGDNERAARAQGIDTRHTKLVGLAIANGAIALSGALVSQYQGFADVGLGLGMIVAGLASVIIGTSLMQRASLGWSATSVVIGSVAYRLVVAVALVAGLGPTDMKLVTAAIVVCALSVPRLRAGPRVRAAESM